MLARLELRGIDVGKRWDAAAKVVREQAGGSVMAFVDAHYALALGSVPPLEGRHHRPRARAVGSARLRGPRSPGAHDHMARGGSRPRAGALRICAASAAARAARSFRCSCCWIPL
jgi:hypothetical protein